MRKVTSVFSVLVVSLTINCCYSQSSIKYADSVKWFASQKMPDKAFENYEKAKAASSRGSDFTDTILPVLKDIAQLYFSKGDRKHTIDVGNEIRALVLKDHGEMNLDYAWACNILGATYNLLGKLDTAKAFHFKAKEIREKLLGESDPAYAQSCNNLGSLYRDYGQFDEAEVLLLKAKAIREANKERAPAVYAITCTGLANLYRDMGQYEKAERLYLEAKDLRAKAGKDNANYAASCNILADLYSYAYMAKPANAEALYLEAKQIIEKIDDESIDYGQTCNNLASLYRDMGQYQKAEALMLKAKRIFEENEDDPSLTININGLGELNYAMGKYQKAESYFLTAGKRWRKTLGPDHPYMISNSEELARLYWKTNQIARANDLFSDVVQLKYRQLNKIFRFTSEKEKQLYLGNITGSNDTYQSFWYKKMSHASAGQPYAMSLLYRNLILSSTQELRQIIHNSRDSALAKMYSDWVMAKKQLANLYAQGPDAKPQLVKELEDRADNLEKSLARSSSAFEKLQRRQTWQDIQKKIKNNEAAIEFIEFRLSDPDSSADKSMYAALVLRKGLVQPMLVPLFEKKKLDWLLEQPGGDEAGNIDKLYSSTNLFTIVWKPVEKYLKGISKVYYAPAGDLFRIAFAAMPVNDKQMLSEKYGLVQLNTTAGIAGLDQDFIAGSDQIQLYGGIDYDADTADLKKAIGESGASLAVARSLPGGLTRGSSFRYLPGTKIETDEIKRQADSAGIRVSLLSGVKATKEAFLSLNDAQSPGILHIATHGFFFEDLANDSLGEMRKKFEKSGKIFRESQNPLFRMGLLFAGGNNIWKGRMATGVGNGIVTAYEISSSMYLPNTKLVVLSACETARGHIEGSEGVYGLQRAFRIAGARNLVMSLWKVPDAGTSEFMQAFYRNMLAGQSVSDAFYKAQAAMRMKYRTEPYQWAAWVLVR